MDWKVVAALGGIAIAGFAAWKWLGGGTSTPTANNPFPGAGNIPIVPAGTTYVNPVLCSIFGRFCPSESPGNGPANECLNLSYILTLPNGNYVYDYDNRGCIIRSSIRRTS